MRDSAYAYAVARIRANETSLLTASDMEQLISAPDLKTALRYLGDQGWGDLEYSTINASLAKQAADAWQLLTDIAPERRELDFLVVKNDFHNLKAALKSFVSDIKMGDVLLQPSLIAPESLAEAIETRQFHTLPDYAGEAAAKTYEVLVHTMDGQLADIMLDAMALRTIRAMAEKTENNFIMNLAELICVSSNIKTAVRAAHTGKDEQFLDTALVETRTIRKETLAAAAAEGTDALLDYLSGTEYQKASELYQQSVAEFEKWCDDLVMSHIINARYISLGIQPLIAYYLAKEAEIKNVRIILSCKHNQVPAQMIRERVRVLYA